MNPALLPPNASMLEKALSCSMDVPPRLHAGTDAVASYKTLPPDPVLPFLIWEYGLGALQPYIKDQRALIQKGLIWQRLRGTPAAIVMALGFIDLSARIEEDGKGKLWATFQLGVAETLQPEQIEHLVTLVNLSKPTRCRLWRIYTDIFDRRPIVLSVGPVLGDGWLSFYSGVPVNPGDGSDGDDSLIVSFGSRRGFQSESYLTRDLAASFGATTWLGFLAPYLDTFRVGRSKLSWVPPRNNPFVIGSLFSILWADRQTRPRQWQGEWDARCWLDYTAFDRKLPPWRMPGRSLSRSQLVPGWGEALADNNARLGVSFATVIDAPPRLGWFRLSAHDNQRRTLRIHEFFIVPRGLASQALQPGTPQTASQSAGAYSAALPDPCRVQQAGHSALAARSHSIGHDVQASRQDSHALACSESQRAGQLCVQSASALHGTPLHLHGAWHGAWDKRRWWPYCADTKISATDCIQSAFMVFNSPGGAFGAPAFASSETLLTPFYFVSES